MERRGLGFFLNLFVHSGDFSGISSVFIMIEIEKCIKKKPENEIRC